MYVSSDPTEPPIVIDTGASCSISPLCNDFLRMKKRSDLSEFKQFDRKAYVSGQDYVSWAIEDLSGVQERIETPAYLVPDAKIRLFSPQTYICDNPSASLLLNHEGVILYWLVARFYVFLLVLEIIFLSC